MNVSFANTAALISCEARGIVRGRWLALFLLILSATGGVIFGLAGRASMGAPTWGAFFVIAVGALALAAHPGSRLLEEHVTQLHRPGKAALLIPWLLTAFLALGVQALIYLITSAIFHPLVSPSLGWMALSIAAALAIGLAARLGHRRA